jgi:D-glycero-alpha-D-manno-heptose-7-phosphate kinase
VDQNLTALRALRAMVYEGHDILVSGRPLREFGELLHHAWEAKRSLDGRISNAEIDEIYVIGREAGAWGGKLLGAGGGGFMLFFAPPEAHVKLRQVFTGRQVLNVKINAPGAQIIFS